jgi:hypothetical protein
MDIKYFLGIPLGDWATIITGLATIALIVVGFIQIKNERNARKKREKEIELQRKRDQAEKISCWIAGSNVGGGGPEETIIVMNQSLQPVYEVVIAIVALGGSGGLKGYDEEDMFTVAVVPPGKGKTSHPAHYQGMMRRPGLEIAFIDAFGKNWVRKYNGELTEILISPIEHFKLTVPRAWKILLPIT